MIDYEWLKLAHLLLFVYWLGGDLGTFYSSLFISRSELDISARATAASIMAGVDQVPRICMALIFPFGLQMAAMRGMVKVGDAILIWTWVISLAWLAMVLVLHFKRDRTFIPLLTRIDFIFRIIVIIVLAAAGTYGLVTGKLIVLEWIAVKTLIFAALVACGLVIRINLRPFGPAFARLLSKGSDPETEQLISSSLARCRPWVYLIWLGLLVCAALSLRVITI